MDEYFAAINEALQQPKEKDLPYTIEAVEGRIEALKAEVESIFNAPPPKPKEEPKEEKKEEGKDGAPEENKEATDAPATGDGQPSPGDAEMKDEGQPAATGEGEAKPADVDMNAGAGEASGQAQE